MVIRRATERTLQISIEACLDIGKHIIAEDRYRFPVDNKDVFSVLMEQGIISSALLPSLMDMARFRNLVVHDYGRIDDAIVYNILKRKLDDLEAYTQAINEYLAHPLPD
jgi:uncharacterized protein YutE (UPF0331/DUF86 family)